MVFNIEAALIAQELAEQSYVAKDYSLAKRFAQRARDLNPDLVEASDFIQAVEILISAETKVNGQTDRYKVLGVSPDADVATIRKSYKNLAARVHPDKNGSVAADGAFKTVSEAWSVLSREAARARHDHRSRVGPTSTLSGGDVGPTFWTGCPACRSEFEYDRRFVDRVVVCPTCTRPFRSIEIGARPFPAIVLLEDSSPDPMKRKRFG